MSDASDTKSILMFCGLHVCEFTYPLKFVYNTKVNTCDAFLVIQRHVQSSKILELPDAHVPS